MNGAPNLTSNQVTVAQYCDFGGCGVSCWKRCELPNGRWDGAPTNLWREVWRLLSRVPKGARRKLIRQAARQPLQLELV